MEEAISQATPVIREEEEISADFLLTSKRDKSLGLVIY